MKRKLLLFALLMALFAPWAAQAQNELTVYDGTITNSIVPAYMGWFDDFTRSQYVIPADDLAEMNGGTISSIKFYTNSSNVPYTSVSTVDVYVMEVGYTTMTALEPKANGTIVYQGFLDVVTEGEGGSLTIEFNTPYTYGGGNLLVGIENTTDAGYKFIYFYGQEITGAAWAGYNSSSLDNVTGSVRDFIPKTTFTYTPGGVITCAKPRQLAVTTNGQTATATWDGTAEDYNIDINGTVTNNVTSPYTFNVALATTYAVKVQANCPADTSAYTNPVSITTPDCLDGHTIDYTLNDSYGDGWNGASIIVVDGCGTTVATLTLSSGASLNGTLENLCGDYYEFIWHTGSYDGECSFTFSEGGTTLFTKPSSVSYGQVLYALGTAPTCVKPTGLAAGTPGVHKVELSWTSDASNWQICVNDDETNLIDVTEKPYTLTGLSPETAYSVKVRAMCGNEQSCWSSNVSFTTAELYTAPINLVCTGTTAYEATLKWTELGDPGNWELEYKEATATEYDTINNRVIVDELPFVLDNLTPNTNYVFRVRSVYPGITESEWSAEGSFTTLVTCPTPTNFAVVTGNDSITDNTATLTWNSIYSTTWDVNYRVPGHYDNPVLEEGFNTSSIPTDWTQYIGLFDETTGTATLSSGSRWYFNTDNGVFDNHARTNVYSTYQAWLVTPSLTIGNNYSLGFDVALTKYSGTLQPVVDTLQSDDKFIVLISTDDKATWTVLRKWDNAGSNYVYNNIATAGENVVLDLSAYAGETVYIAFYGESTNPSDMANTGGDNNLHIDNVNVGKYIEATGWQTAIAEEVPFELTGLNPLTPYEVYVIGNCPNDESDPTQTLSFTTLPSCLAPEGLALANVLNNLTAHTATLSWTANGTETQWVIEYTAIVDGQAVTNTVNVTENPYTLGSLLEGTPYAVKVQAYCNAHDQSDWSNTVLFTTPLACPAPTNLAVDEESLTTTGATINWNGTSDSYVVMIGVPDPENEETITIETTIVDVDFETGNLSQANFVNDATYAWTVVQEGQDGGYCMKSTNSGVSYSSTAIELTVVLEGESTLSFDFWSRGESTTDTYDWDVSRFFIDGEQMFQYGKHTTWESYETTLTAGTHTLKWLYKKDNITDPEGDCFYVDNIKIGTVVTMPAPSSWTEYTTEDPTYTFDNLEAGTTYFAQVKSICDGEQPHISDIISFTTIASCITPTDFAVTQVTGHTATMVWNGTNQSYMVNYRVAASTNTVFGQDFENGLGEWTFTSMNTINGIGGSGTYPAGIYPAAAHDGSNGFRFSSYTSADDYNQYLVSPEMNVVGELKFYAWRYGTGDNLYIGISTTTDELDAFTWNALSFASTSTWQEFSQEITSDVKYIAFHYYGNYAYYAYLDDLNITVPVPVGEWIPAPVADTTVTIDNLAPTTAYEARLQGICDGEESDWTNIIAFTTTVACPAITRLDTVSVGAHEAVVSWHEVGLASEWQICLNGDENNLIVTTDTIYTFENLEQDGDYTVKVRANCGGDDGTSTWSNTLSFHTKVTCAKPTNLQVTGVTNKTANVTWDGESEYFVVQYNPWHQVGSDRISTEVLKPYTFDLSEYSGRGSIAIRHYDVTDVFYLNVDDIEVTNAQGEVVFSENFESGNIPSTMTNLDYDGDGYVWTIRSQGQDDYGNPTVNGNYGVTSASWYSQYVGALNPDNWLIINDVELGGSLTFMARGQDPDYPAENFGVFVFADNEFEDHEEEADENEWEFTGLKAGTIYEWRVKGFCDEDGSQWATSSFATLENLKTFVKNGNWNDGNNWEPVGVPTFDDKVQIDSAAYIPAGVVAQAKKATLGEGSITIADGGQLKQGSASLHVTMEKVITGYGEGNDKWYLISAPFNGRTVIGHQDDWSSVDSLALGVYDFYALDPMMPYYEDWLNYKITDTQSHELFDGGMLYGEGYLYARQKTAKLSYEGTTWSSYNAQMAKGYLYYPDTLGLLGNGWRLVGNPYTCNAYLSFVNDEDEQLEANFYVMNANGNGLELAETGDALPPLTGAFVQYNTTGYVKYDSEEPNPAKYVRTGKFVMNLSQGDNTIDKAVVRFGKGMSLEKMSFNNNSSKLYITVDGNDYAVVYKEKAATVPVSFKAETAGSYTINYTTDSVTFGELILIDNANGKKVDLLANPSYTFETEAGDFD